MLIFEQIAPVNVFRHSLCLQNFCKKVVISLCLFVILVHCLSARRKKEGLFGILPLLQAERMLTKESSPLVSFIQAFTLIEETLRASFLEVLAAPELQVLQEGDQDV